MYVVQGIVYTCTLYKTFTNLHTTTIALATLYTYKSYRRDFLLIRYFLSFITQEKTVVTLLVLPLSSLHVTRRVALRYQP